MTEEKKLIRNVVRDTRKDIKYVILAERKLTFLEKMRQIRFYNYNPARDRPKSGEEIVFNAFDV